jgi:hypothetical protein
MVPNPKEMQATKNPLDRVNKTAAALPQPCGPSIWREKVLLEEETGYK